MKKKKLIVNADDFGQSPGINKGIIQAYEQGILTSASLMVRYSAAMDAAMYAKKNPALGIGLHVDLGEWIYKNDEWEPLYEVVTLEDAEAIKLEVRNQLDAFYQIMGQLPTHIDSHQHVHQREAIRPILLEIAKELNVTLRGCSENVSYCGKFYGQLDDGSPYHYAISVEGLEKTISSLPEGITEMACHPGLQLDIETMYKNERELEVATLCSKTIQHAIAAGNVELCSFRNIPFHSVKYFFS
jgi:predicted glycoside hydrolase/deacetylase ChbG (UPF0249 family)